MAHVRMRTYISGGRGDGSQWPDAGGILECGDGEAADLVRAGLAWPHVAEVPPERAVSHAEPPIPDDRYGLGGESEYDLPGDANSPAVRAAKQDWVMHAVTLGADPVVASALTKADLIARYG